MKLTISFLVLLFIFGNQVIAQTSETPLSDYTWKRGKTQPAEGFVVLKSGKRLEGTIVLKGSERGVEEVVFEGEGKEIDFPVAALQSYGLNKSTSSDGQNNTANGPISDSPEKHV